MKPIKYALLIVGAAALAACETEPKQTLSPGFGNAVKHNMAVHIINPEGSPEPVQAPDLDGNRAVKAYSDMLTRGAGGGGYRAMPGQAGAAGASGTSVETGR